MAADSVEVALARVETQITALRADLSRYFDELSNQDERLRTVESAVGRLSERLAIFSLGIASLQIVITAIAAWIASR